MDGGITDSIPYKKAMEAGCDKNIVILTRETGYKKTTDKSTEFAAHKVRNYEKFAEKLLSRADRYNKNVAELEQLEREGKVFVFRPDDTSGIGRTESDPEVLKGLYMKGMECARARMPELREYLNRK